FQAEDGIRAFHVTGVQTCALPIFIENAIPSKMGGHPRNIILLTCDAQGVMPPIARLTPDQALYHFISGYTSKVGGTEIGLGAEPQITFSTCFGAPFMVHHPTVYADLDRKSTRLNSSHVKISYAVFSLKKKIVTFK